MFSLKNNCPLVSGPRFCTLFWSNQFLRLRQFCDNFREYFLMLPLAGDFKLLWTTWWIINNEILFIKKVFYLLRRLEWHSGSIHGFIFNVVPDNWIEPPSIFIVKGLDYQRRKSFSQFYEFKFSTKTNDV